MRKAKDLKGEKILPRPSLWKPNTCDILWSPYKSLHACTFCPTNKKRASIGFALESFPWGVFWCCQDSFGWSFYSLIWWQDAILVIMWKFWLQEWLVSRLRVFFSYIVRPSGTISFFWGSGSREILNIPFLRYSETGVLFFYPVDFCILTPSLYQFTFFCLMEFVSLYKKDSYIGWSNS